MSETALALSKPYYSISEVSSITQIKPHVLRYWETQFSMLRPKKNRAGNRMYRPQDIELVLYLKELLYARRFTIQGARRKLLDDRRAEEPGTKDQVKLEHKEAERRRLLGEVRLGLEALLETLKAPVT